MTFALLALLLSTPAHHGPPIPSDFDLADLPADRAVADNPDRFMLGEIEARGTDPVRPILRMRGAKVKLRVPIG